MMFVRDHISAAGGLAIDFRRIFKKTCRCPGARQPVLFLALPAGLSLSCLSSARFWFVGNSLS